MRQLIVVLCVVLLGAVPVFAQDGEANPYIQINNSNISITATEQPQIVLQFGNRGQETFYNAGILCITTGEVFLTGTAFTNNAFPPFDADLSIAPDLPGVALPNQAISFPSALSFLGLADDFTDIPRGQNFNVAFNIEIRQDDDPETNGGQVLCALVNGAGVANVAQMLDLGPENLTDEAVIELVQSVAEDLAAAEVTVR